MDLYKMELLEPLPCCGHLQLTALELRGERAAFQSPVKRECSWEGITSLSGGDKGVRWEAVLSLEWAAVYSWF